jgi:hypothetical protein
MPAARPLIAASADLIREWLIKRERRRMNRALDQGRTGLACECWHAIRKFERWGRGR